jgi:hypothetical protein
MKRLLAMMSVLAVGGLAAAGCGGETTDHRTPEQRAKDTIVHKAHQRTPYVPSHDVEFHNYNRAQQVYDDPSNILWCTFSFNNPSSPLVTVPVTGKLTSSSTTFFSPEQIDDRFEGPVVVPSRSVDGLYHPNPPGYRYGFTPGGAYVDFFNLETYCSNKPTEFQRKQTKMSLTVDHDLGAADAAAQAALKAGRPAEAQRIIEAAIGGQ